MHIVASSIGRTSQTPLESHQLAVEHINDNDIIAICLYHMNKMRWNLIKVRPRAIVRWFNRFEGYFWLNQCLGF